jgi:hypothetical protein
MRRIEAEIAQQEIEEKQAAAKQVFMTNKGDDVGQATGDPPSQAAHDGDAGKEQGNLPPATDPTTEQLPEIQGRPRPLQPAVPVVHHPEDFMTPMDKVIYGTLGDPITPDYIRNSGSLFFRRHHCCISLALLSSFAAPERNFCRCASKVSLTRTRWGIRR